MAVRSRDPILLTGPTGAGKSLLARRIHGLVFRRRREQGPFVEVNCATVRGDGAMSALFGHVRGAFTGAVRDRDGHLLRADGGILFLDEIGELGLEEQAMLLRAIEERRFFPVGADVESRSDFQLIAGTNRDLAAEVREGRFRADLLARIDLWTFELPPLRDRTEDLEPNLRFELERFAERTGTAARFNREARSRFLAFATAPETPWTSNFRDLNAAVTRMATLAPAGRITVEEVDEEIERLRRSWFSGAPADGEDLEDLLGGDRVAELDLFDRLHLVGVVRVCRDSRSLADAGRRLFAVSRERKTTSNDSDRLRKYLARFGLSWSDVRGG